MVANACHLQIRDPSLIRTLEVSHFMWNCRTKSWCLKLSQGKENRESFILVASDHWPCQPVVIMENYSAENLCYLWNCCLWNYCLCTVQVSYTSAILDSSIVCHHASLFPIWQRVRSKSVKKCIWMLHPLKKKKNLLSVLVFTFPPFFP